MSFKIREATVKDYNGIKELIMEVHKLHVQNRPDIYNDVKEVISKEIFESLLRSYDTEVFVVENEENNEIVGYSTIKLTYMPSMSEAVLPREVAFINDFCIKSTYRNKGLGGQLFRSIKKYLRNEEMSTIELFVWEFNKDTIRFFEKMGMSTMNRKMELKL